MKTVKILKCYEYYDGLQVGYDNEYMLIPDDGSNLKTFQDQIFTQLPLSGIEIFHYTSRFSNEITFLCLTKIPSTLKEIYLEHYDDVDMDIIKDIKIAY